MAKVKTATLRRGRGIFVLTATLAILAAWLARHVYQVLSPHPTTNASLALVWLISFIAIMWTTTLALLERPKRTTPRQERELNKLKVAVLIPAYNEDEELLKNCIQSLLRQTRKPDVIEVVDDGSLDDYPVVRAWLGQLKGRYPGITLRWTRTKNGGKRHAQATGIRHTMDADVYLTVDSDTILDPQAIAEGLKPFADPRVQSVAGICLPLNVNDNLLTRFTGLWETVWQLVERSAQSTMNSVTVNSGVLAFYRGDTVRKYLGSYLNETFFGHPVKFSDDSLMTLYAKVNGRTVQQTTSLSFSAVPNRTSHHIKRYLRWMRGSFIRTWWRFKYLPLNSYVYWLHLFRWIQFALSTVVGIYLLKSGLLANARLWPYLIAMPIILSYLQSMRYLIVRRSDETRTQQVITYLTAPIAMLWLLTVLKVVKYYAYATVFKTGWGTRKQVEVGMGSAA
jgi:hyaluronan synthase